MKWECECDGEKVKVGESMKIDYEDKKEFKIEKFKCKKCNKYKLSEIETKELILV